MEKIQRAIIYIRVSTSEQALRGYSLQAQKEFLESYAEAHGMRVVAVFADEGQTARKELKKRKAIHALLEAVKRDEVDVILFWKMDRWFRNVSDFYKVQDVLDAHHVRWIAVAEPNMSLDTREGRLNLNIMLSIGQNEVDTTSERIKFTVDSMIKNGRVVWGDANLPIGYHIEDKRIVKTEAEIPIVEEFFQYIKTYRNKRQTIRHIQDTFGIPFTQSHLRTMLTSDIYAGKYRDNFQYCPAYISYEELQEIRKLLKTNIKHAPSGRIYLFSGMVYCPVCQTKLVGTGCRSIINRTTGEKRTYCYYRCNKAIIDHACTNTHRVSQNLLEEYLLNNLEQEYRFFQISCSSISDKNMPKKKKRTPEKINDEINRLNTMFQMGRIDFAYYDEQYLKLSAELQESNAVAKVVPKDYSKVEGLLSGNFRSMYQSLNQENRQAFWHSIIKEIHLNAESQVDHIIFW